MTTEPEFYALTGQYLRALREGFHRSQQDVADHLGTHANTVSRWETAAYRPSAYDLWRLAQYYGVSTASFFPEYPDPVFKTTKDLVRGLLAHALVQIDGL